MARRFDNTVSALCYSFIAEWPPLGCDGYFYHNEVVRFVIDQHHRMPDYLRLPIKMVTFVFDICGIFYGLSLFHNLPPELRALQIQSWRKARLGPMRDFVRLYESLTLFAWYSKNCSAAVRQETK